MQEFYIILRELWLLWFMALFMGIVAWVYWPGRRSRLQEQAFIPLQDDDGVAPRGPVQTR